MIKQKSYEQAYQIATNSLIALPYSDILDKVYYSGASDVKGESGKITFTIKLFDDDIRISYPDFNFEMINGGVVSLVSKIIILHYLEKMNHNINQLNNLISYKYIPGAFNYYPVFQKKAITPLIEKYNSLSKVEELFSKIFAVKENLGTFSFKLKALPKIDITFIFWAGDDEFAPSIDFLFDESIKDMLSLEDVVVVSSMMSKRLLFVR